MNNVYFSKEQVANGEMYKFLNLLFEQCYGKGDNYNDVRVYPDDLGAFVIEWEQVPWSHEWGGRFVFKTFEEIDEELFMKESSNEGVTDEDIERDTEKFFKECDCGFFRDCESCN